MTCIQQYWLLPPGGLVCSGMFWDFNHGANNPMLIGPGNVDLGYAQDIIPGMITVTGGSISSAGPVAGFPVPYLGGSTGGTMVITLAAPLNGCTSLEFDVSANSAQYTVKTVDALSNETTQLSLGSGTGFAWQHKFGSTTVSSIAQIKFISSAASLGRIDNLRLTASVPFEIPV